jgi:hypothetical protein
MTLFEKFIDNTGAYITVMLMVSLFGFSIGLLLGSL